MTGVGEKGRTRRDVSRQANDANVQAAGTALQHKGDRAKGPGTSTNPRPNSGLKRRSK